MSETLWQGLASKNSVQFSTVQNSLNHCRLGITQTWVPNLSSAFFKVCHLEQVIWGF